MTKRKKKKRNKKRQCDCCCPKKPFLDNAKRTAAWKAQQRTPYFY